MNCSVGGSVKNARLHCRNSRETYGYCFDSDTGRENS